jgi:hypothetical protein
MNKPTQLTETLRDALTEERITGAAYRARRADDTLANWTEALDRLDGIVKEIGAVLEKPQPTEDEETQK